MAGGTGRDGTGAERRSAVDGWLVALVVLGVLAAVACLVATRERMGIETDSGPYLSAAYNLAHGRGISTPFTFLSAYGPRESLAFGNRVPLVDYPPLYPVVGGGLAALGIPLEQALRYLGAVLLGVNVVLVGILFLTVTKGRARPIAVALPLFMLIGPTSPNLAAAGRENWLTLHASLLSEPLFITLTLTACLLVTRAVRDGIGGPLAAATACAALAVLTRNVGVAVVAASSLTVFVARRAWWRRALLVAAAGFAPAVAWAVWVRVGEGAVSGRALAPRSAAGTWKDLLDAVEKWLLPSPWHSTLRHALLLGVAVVVVGLALVQRRSGNLAFVPVVQLCLLTAGYVVAIVGSRVFFDVNAIDERMLAPVQPAVLIVAAAFVWSGLRTVWTERVAVGAVAATLVVLMAVSVHPIATFVSDGFGPLRLSPAARSVHSLPRGIPVFANQAAAVWFATGRSAYELPTRTDKFSLARNHHYRAQMAELAALAQRRPVAVVLLYIPNFASFPSIGELEQLGTVRVRQRADGVVVIVGGPPVLHPHRR